VEFFQGALERLGAAPGLAHGCPVRGIVLTSSATPAGERFVHLLNLDGFDKPIRLTDGGRELLPGREFVLRAREGVMLPLGVSLGPARVVRSTAEIAGVAENAVTFRLTQGADVIELETNRVVVPSEEYEVERRGDRWIVTSRRPACGGVDRTEELLVRFG
jgi:beta-galactosidase